MIKQDSGLDGSLHFQNRLHDTHFHGNRELGPILKAALKKFSLPSPIELTDHRFYWNEEFYGLDRLRIYRNLDQEQKDQVIRNCNRSTMEEAFYIEKSGMTYAAKMTLLAETNDERALYSLFGADEASHFNAIYRFMLGEARSFERQHFLRLLDQLVHEGSFNVLVYMIQVILEGWGLYHYRGLYQECQDQALKEVLRLILADEAKHHGSGLVILPQKKWGLRDQTICEDSLVSFIKLVRIGPLSLIQSLEDILGSLEFQDKLEIYEEWGGCSRIQSGLDLIRNLMIQHTPDPKLIEVLEQYKLFEAASAKEFANFSA